jgi:hypothetical protein
LLRDAQAAAVVMAGKTSLPIAAEPYRAQRKETPRQALRLWHKVDVFVATWVHFAPSWVSLAQSKLLCRKVNFPGARSTPLSQSGVTLRQRSFPRDNVAPPCARKTNFATKKFKLSQGKLLCRKVKSSGAK